MSRADPVHEAADAIERAWQSGRCCELVGRGLQARVLQSARLRAHGYISDAELTRIASEALNVALAFPPLPVLWADGHSLYEPPL